MPVEVAASKERETATKKDRHGGCPRLGGFMGSVPDFDRDATT